MTDGSESGGITRPRLDDLLVPRRLFERINLQPTFVLPALALVASVVAYSQLAIGPALPQILPTLLDRSPGSERDLARTFRMFILVASLLGPAFFLAFTAFGSWLLLRLVRSPQPFSIVLSIVSFSSLWIAISFLVRAVLVLVTEQAQPSTNLNFFLKPSGNVERTLLAFTNPFVLLSAWWTWKGLGFFGATGAGRMSGGVLPWFAWVVLAAGSGGGDARLAPSGPVSFEGWKTIEGRTVSFRHPPSYETTSEETTKLLDGFVEKLAGDLGFEPVPVRVIAFPDHASLERAMGGFLHVQVTGAIRGEDLVYTEMPGTSAAVTRHDITRHVMRLLAVLQLRTAAGLAETPIWFRQGLAHLVSFPAGPARHNEYVSVFRDNVNLPYDRLLDEPLYLTPQGPVVARSVVESLTSAHGPGIVGDLCRDVARGGDFRDALYARTRLTIDDLETYWHQWLQAALQHRPREGATAEADTAAGELQPFRSRR